VKPWLRMAAWNVAGFTATFYVGYGVLVWSLQESLFFPAPGGIDRQALDFGAAEVGADAVDLVASDGTRLYGWHYRGREERLVLYFPGNAETVAGNIALHRLLLHHDWDVAALAYRGYPGSEGSPSEAGLVMDAQALWDWALDEGYEPDSIVLHGRSLGGGVAAHLAERENPAGLVLESSFRSLREVARRFAPLHPVDWMIRHPFDTEQRAPLLGVPTFIVHSQADRVIPLDVSAYAVNDRFAEVETMVVGEWEHSNSLPVVSEQVREAYVRFLDRLVPRERY